MKNFFKKVLGITEMERAIEETRLQIEKAEEAKKAAELAVEQSLKEAEEAKLTPKDRATARKEPWVAVLDTKVNKDNVRNGFFELDWNEYFIVQLRSEGYTGSSDEEIVDQWFQELCRNIGNETGIDMERRGSGFVQRALREDGKTEVS